MSKSYARTKKNFISTALASFAGIMVAVPVMIGLYGLGNNIAGATQDQTSTSTAQVSGIPADFAKFAYAYNQGYMAQAKSNGSVASASVGTCSEATASTDGDVLGASTIQQPSRPAGHHEEHQAELADVVRSYNTYVYNSSSSEINNTNSNNTVGSNNTNETEIAIKDSEKLSVEVKNETEGTNISNNDSFNEDSYNTKTETETEIINNSFNEEKLVAIDSGNTENVAVNKVDDSYNTETETTTVEKTETETTTINEDSNNTVGDVEGDVEVELQADPNCIR